MGEWLWDLLATLPWCWKIFFIAMVPVTELRVAVPLGLVQGMEVWPVYLYALLGNLVPLLLLVFLFPFFYDKLKKIGWFAKVFEKIFNYIDRKRNWVDQYGFWGLILFVAIPLPGSGIWSGALLAFLLRLKPAKSFLALSLGAVLSGWIMVFLSQGVLGIMRV